jgi:hypothetical protein
LATGRFFTMGRRLLITGLLLHWAALSSALADDWFQRPPDVPHLVSPAAFVSEASAVADTTVGPPMTLAEECCCQRSGFFAGADYRLVRTHFSEATAFATLTAGAGPQGPDLRVRGTDVRFDYQSAVSVFAGYHFNDLSDVRFTYFHLDSQATALGAALAPNQVIVDPIGNLAPFGTAINTRATVKLNVFDLEYIHRIEDAAWPVGMQYSAGLRVANINQFFDANIGAGGAQLSDGVFRMNWYGVGPYTSILGRLYGPNRRFSTFAKAGAALLVGKNDIEQQVSVTGAFTATQTAGRILVVPVLESELGASWQPNDQWRFSAGWFVQAWFDMGISGASFSGANLPLVGFPALANVFTEADDSSIMAFDGLFLRAEYYF